MVDPHVGARIRARRIELGLTLQNVADRTQLSKSFLSQVEIGKAWPSVRALEQIGAVLGASAGLFAAAAADHITRPMLANSEPANSDAPPSGSADDASPSGSADDAPGGKAPVHRADLGRRLRAARVDRRLSLRHVGDQAGLSKSFISQVELGQSAASLGTLKRICAVLDIPVWALLDDQPEPGGTERSDDEPGDVAIVRGHQRKVRRYPGSTTDISLLTPDLNRKMEVTLSVLQPGDGYGHETYTHRGEEFGLVLAGTYEVTVDGTAHVLGEGDSIYFSSRLPHRTRALGETPVTTLWVVTPPS